MRQLRMLALGALLAALFGACGTGGGGRTPGTSPGTPATGAPSASGAGATPGETQATQPAETGPAATGPGADVPPVRIGSAGFYESALMAEIYAQALEANGYQVERQLQIGPRDQTMPAIQAGEFDLMPEYIGSSLEFLNEGAGEASADSEATAERLGEVLAESEISVLGFTPAQDTNAFVVREETANEMQLEQMSDLAAVQTRLTWGLPPECETNPLCGGALSEEYGIDFDSIEIVELGACGAEIATALDEEAVDIGELCSTQPDIAQFGFVVLDDDKGTQPAENIAPIVRNDYLEQVDREAFAAILDEVSAAMTTEDLTALNVRVGVDQEDFDVVASDWLTENGFVVEGE